MMKLTKIISLLFLAGLSHSTLAGNEWRASLGSNINLMISANSNGVATEVDGDVEPTPPTSCMDLADKPDGEYEIYENGLDNDPVQRTCATPHAELGSGWSYVGQFYATRGTNIRNAQGDHQFSKIYVEFASNSSYISAWPDHRSSAQSNGVLVAGEMIFLDRLLGTGYSGAIILHDYESVGNHPIEVWHLGRYYGLNWTNDVGSFRVNIYVQ